MRIPSWMIVAAAVLAALPFGWGLGVAAAELLAGPDFGQLPAATVPLGILAAVAFAISPIASATTRLKIMLAGTGVFVLLAWLAG